MKNTPYLEGTQWAFRFSPFLASPRGHAFEKATILFSAPFFSLPLGKCYLFMVLPGILKTLFISYISLSFSVFSGVGIGSYKGCTREAVYFYKPTAEPTLTDNYDII